MLPRRDTSISLRSEAARSLADNAMADAVPLLEALASGRPQTLQMPLSTMLSLKIEISPSFARRAAIEPKGPPSWPRADTGLHHSEEHP